MSSKNILHAVVGVSLGILLILATLVGLLVAGVFDSEPSSVVASKQTPTPSAEPNAAGNTEPAPTPTPKETATPDATPTPEPTPTPISEPTPTIETTPTPEPDPTATPDAGPGREPLVERDPGYEEALDSARFSISGWETDFSLHSVPYSEIRGGGPPADGIPPIDAPEFVTAQEADDWLAEKEPVIALEINGDVRAYPLQILTWHEIVNDEVGGVPVSVTFCPLCNAAIVFDRRLDGAVYDFGISGNLRKSDLIMWDRQTSSWWQQFSGEAIAGTLTGRKLTFLPSTIVSFGFIKEAYPDVKVLSRDTGFARPYGRNPYAGYDRADNPPFLFDGLVDGRLLPVSNQQKWDTLGAERSWAGWRSGELPDGPIVASPPFDGLSLHLLPAL